jgi:hypothetical protein
MNIAICFDRLADHFLAIVKLTSIKLLLNKFFSKMLLQPSSN